MQNMKVEGFDFLVEKDLVASFSGPSDLYSRCRRYSKRIEFHVRHVEKRTTVWIQGADGRRLTVSGFPQSVQYSSSQSNKA